MSGCGTWLWGMGLKMASGKENMKGVLARLGECGPAGLQGTCETENPWRLERMCLTDYGMDSVSEE